MAANVRNPYIFARALNAVPSAIRATLMAAVHVVTYPRAPPVLRLAGTPAAGRLDSPALALARRYTRGRPVVLS